MSDSSPFPLINEESTALIFGWNATSFVAFIKGELDTIPKTFSFLKKIICSGHEVDEREVGGPARVDRPQRQVDRRVLQRVHAQHL